MVKYFIEEEKEELVDGKLEKVWKKKSEEKDLKDAKDKAIKPKERVHVCFHDELHPKPCQIH